MDQPPETRPQPPDPVYAGDVLNVHDIDYIRHVAEQAALREIRKYGLTPKGSDAPGYSLSTTIWHVVKNAEVIEGVDFVHQLVEDSKAEDHHYEALAPIEEE